MARRTFLQASVLSSFAESAIKTQYTQPSSSLATSTNTPKAWCSPPISMTLPPTCQDPLNSP